MFEPSTIAAIALKTILLVVGVGIIAIVAARQSAAWRHSLWTCALALCVLMPFAVAYLPSFAQISLPSQDAASWVRDESGPIPAGLRHVDSRPDVLGPAENNVSRTPYQARAAGRTVVMVWLIGALCVMLRNALAHIGLLRWTRNAQPELSPAWAATLHSVARETGFRRLLRVLESDRTTNPCTWWLMRPVVLLPTAGADWPEPQRRFALLHELAHVRRFDYLTTQIANMACAVHWYNPLVWFAAAQALRLQEQACDDAVLNAGSAASDYAQFLVNVASGSRRISSTFPVAVGMVQRSQLHGRVTAILDESRARLPLSRLALLTALAPLACLTFLLATVSAQATPIVLQPGVPLAASFRSVEVRNGGKVNLIHGQSQRVTLLSGDPQLTAVTMRDDGRLVIDRCKERCPRGHDLEVEIVTPDLAALAVAEGGTIQSRGDFPSQPHIDATVSQGGTIDIRSMAVQSVTASVESGGRIFVAPATALSATIEQGGVITYWGDAVVKSSVQHGGVVARGAAADADKSLAELAPEVLPPLPPIPPVPPVRTIQPTGR
jgi:beta-lactamase regulating signal transducer with metallopeptidase domain